MDTLPQAPEEGAPDELGDRMKAFEQVTDTRLEPDRPTVIRLDGRAFHTFTRGLLRPFDPRLAALMRDTTLALAEECNAAVAYTQSDEISLILTRQSPNSDPYFGGRVQKLVSVLASLASVHFNRHLATHLPEKAHLRPVFDARAFQVPDLDTVAEVLKWRELDAYRNGVLSLAQANFSHKEIQGKGRAQLLAMLLEKGVRFDVLPRHARGGSFLLKREVLREFTTDELDKLPEKHAARTNPDLMVKRAIREFRDDLPPLALTWNTVGVLFGGETPEHISQDPNK